MKPDDIRAGCTYRGRIGRQRRVSFLYRNSWDSTVVVWQYTKPAPTRAHPGRGQTSLDAFAQWAVELVALDTPPGNTHTNSEVLREITSRYATQETRSMTRQPIRNRTQPEPDFMKQGNLGAYAECISCGQLRKLRKGVLRKHFVKIVGQEPMECPGSAQPPASRE